MSANPSKKWYVLLSPPITYDYLSFTRAAFSSQVWARLLSRNRRNLERVLRLDAQQEDEPSLLYEANRVVAAAGEDDVEDTGGGWQLFDHAAWEDIAAAVWAKQSDLYEPTPADNPYLERAIDDAADLEDVALQRQEEGGDQQASTTATSSASKASGESHESSEDGSDVTESRPVNSRKRKLPVGGRGAGGRGGGRAGGRGGGGNGRRGAAGRPPPIRLT